ncbi:amidase signature domain-containing protein [Kockovaella imperatae]|uniref:Amidase signature domain-containing protein n=1 Tax=Kockovaella imperatae TaxID=4999 RepID=A0A1Y1U7R1_9TREE|nr:amidase signature domain-containing protein [Kockovaella imperatae]ORX34070.1 amidase signature domain-containing protein [Kockovaella imperatae]
MPISSSYLTASETIALAAKDELSILQLARDHIARFEQRDPAVRAWEHYDRERILKEAARLDSLPKEKRGPLFGATLGVKDVMNTLDMPTTYGSKAYQGHRPGSDAPLVHVLRNAGVLILGKTVTTEFASTMDNVPTLNPYDASRTPGGSSSGSGAAVRDFQCQLALGTQTGGSMVRPASFNGIFCIKPTWNSISRDGIKVSSLILDTPGLYARSLTDLQLLLKVLNVHDDVPPPMLPKPLSDCRFAYVKTVVWDSEGQPSREVERAWAKSRQLLEEAGAHVEDLDLGQDFENIVNGRHADIMSWDAGLNFYNEYEDPVNRRHLAQMLVEKVEARSAISQKQYLHALDSIPALRPRFDAIAEQYDAIVTPSVPGEAPQGTKTGTHIFNAMWTVLHVPCVNVPGFAGENGMPVGLTLVGPRFHDERLLTVSRSVAHVWLHADATELRPLPVPEGVKMLQI